MVTTNEIDNIKITIKSDMVPIPIPSYIKNLIILLLLFDRK